jgi:hypothetical protein
LFIKKVCDVCEHLKCAIIADGAFFVAKDIVLALIESDDPKQYIQRMRERDESLSQGWVQIVHTLDMSTKGGRQKMACANLEGIFRIINAQRCQGGR